MVKTRVVILRVIEGPNARDQSALCAFHSFLVEVQTKCWLHACDACVITARGLGLRATRGARNNIYYAFVDVHS